MSNHEERPQHEDGVTADADDLIADPDFEAKHEEAILAFFSGLSDVAPPMHACDPATFADLSARIPTLRVLSAGGASPYESTGTLRGLAYSFRYRHGYAELRLRALDAGAHDADLNHLYAAGTSYGSEYGGELTREEFRSLMLTLVARLERAPFLWEFVPRTSATATAETSVVSSWGHTPAEALAAYADSSRYPDESETNDLTRGRRPLTRQAWDEHVASLDLDPTPINTDDRVYPDPEPTFTVLPDRSETP